MTSSVSNNCRRVTNVFLRRGNLKPSADEVLQELMNGDTFDPKLVKCVDLNLDVLHRELERKSK